MVRQTRQLVTAFLALAIAAPLLADDLPPVERDDTVRNFTLDAKPPATKPGAKAAAPVAPGLPARPAEDPKDSSSGSNRLISEGIDIGIDVGEQALKHYAKGSGGSSSAKGTGAHAAAEAEAAAAAGAADDAARTLNQVHPMPAVSPHTAENAVHNSLKSVGTWADDTARGGGIAGAAGFADDAARGVGPVVGLADDAARGIGGLAKVAAGGAAAVGAGVVAASKKKKK